jgi:hypothetical protein
VFAIKSAVSIGTGGAAEFEALLYASAKIDRIHHKLNRFNDLRLYLRGFEREPVFNVGSQLCGSIETLSIGSRNMTVQDILAKVANGELSADAASKLIQANTPPVSARGTMIKTNQSGGLCVQAPQLVAFSKDKNKQYRYTLNMPMDAAKVLFSDAQLIAEIAEFVKAA